MSKSIIFLIFYFFYLLIFFAHCFPDLLCHLFLMKMKSEGKLKILKVEKFKSEFKMLIGCSIRGERKRADILIHTVIEERMLAVIALNTLR